MLKRKFDKLVASGKGTQLIWLMVISAIALGGALIYALVRGNAAFGWRETLAIFLDPGNFMLGASSGHEWFGLFMALLSIFLFSALLVSTFINVLENIGTSVREGKRRYNFQHHILVLGSGKKLQRIVDSLKNDSRSIVVMSPNPVCANSKVVYYNGLRDSYEDLLSTDASNADMIYIIGEDNEPGHDAKSLQALEMLKEICSSATHDVYCYLSINETVTQEVFQYYRQNGESRLLLVDVINDYEYYAEQLMVGTDFLPVIKSGEDKTCHIIIVGTGKAAQSAAYTAAHICHYPSYTEFGRKTEISFVDTGMKTFRDMLIASRPHLFAMSEWTYMSPDSKTEIHHADNGDILDIKWNFIDAAAESAEAKDFIVNVLADTVNDVRIIVCGKNDTEVSARVLHLPRAAYDIPSIALFLEESVALIDKAHETNMYGNLVVFGPASAHDDALFQRRSMLGQRVNFIYDQAYAKDPSKTVEEAWYKQSESNKFSSIYCANAMPLRRLCYDLSKPDRRPVYEAEHRRWLVSELIMGYAPGPKTDKANFIHADIVPFDALPPSEQEKDKTLIDKIDEICR